MSRNTPCSLGGGATTALGARAGAVKAAAAVLTVVVISGRHTFTSCPGWRQGAAGGESRGAGGSDMPGKEVSQRQWYAMTKIFGNAF